MALFKPATKKGTRYTGLCKSAIVGFEDRSGQYEFGDLLLEVHLKQEGQEWPRKMSIMGVIEKDPTTNVVTGGNAFTRLYAFFEAIGCKAGLNIKGDWEDENGDVITDIAEYLTARYAQDANAKDLNFDYYAYYYKEAPKGPNKKSYVRVMPMLTRANKEGEQNIMQSVEWRKSKGFLKEWDETMAPTESADIGLGALENL